MAARLAAISVRGLRCLDGLELSFEPLTALIGANGAGKSSTVRALQFLFGEVDLDDDDVSDGIADPEVSVTGVLTDLPGEWTERLRPWLSPDGTLTVTRSRVLGPDSRAVVRWSCDRAQVPAIAGVRAAVASGAPAARLKELYGEARAEVGDGLPPYSNKQAALEALDAFEREHPEAATQMAPDSTLRFGGGGDWDLSRMLELLVLPAMRDAADDASDGKGSTLGRLVEITVRSGLDLDGDLAGLSERTARAYEQILAERAAPRLQELSASITEQINAFAPGTQVTLAWQPRVPALAPPQVRARIVESGHEADIGRQGHGVQRAYVFSLLRALLDARRGQNSTDQPGLLLVIEEPEVYQHPVRARYVARVLADLARDPVRSTQVVYTTHSPYFVSVDDVPSARLLRLCPTGGEAGPAACTRAFTASLTTIAERLEAARQGSGQRWTAERVAAQLPALLGSRLSEGLFAEAVVLVEGDEDLGLIDGAATAVGVDLAAAGIALVAVQGKSNLLLAAEVVRALGVPEYVVFDTDEKPAGQASDPGALRLNGMLAELAGGPDEERPLTTVQPRWAAAKPTLRAVLNDEVGAQVVREAYTRTARAMGLPESTEKNGHMVRTAMLELYGATKRSETLDRIVEAVTDLTVKG
ncbi:AAA family ATPase [Blastococcus sp. BMG 814]|uniref:AAA family ATPase n=1 Tax=Blastococcus carthaginiensis TaxID=3050034 RepID=A0ABT9I9Y6_9ACTN|nr:AAA family ATPase [Blastococcus carthaginiensis]MDP5182376.1 AAA family ATPase [Blastococcus carthaginiensis]